MPLTWNILRTDAFGSEANQNFATDFVPAGYTTLGVSNALGIKDNILCFYNTALFDPPCLVSGINAGAGGGRIRSTLNTVTGNLPGVGWTAETGTFSNGSCCASHFHAVNASGQFGYRMLALSGASGGTNSVRLSIKTSAADTRVIASTLVTGLTTLNGNILDSGYIIISASIHLLFVKLYAANGTTLLGECSTLLYNDWPNSPGVSSNNKFSVGGAWSSQDNISYYDYAYVGALQTGEAYIFNVCQTGTLTVYCTPGQGGTGPYTYQWEKNINSGGWNNVVGGTSVILKETGVTGSVQYRCKITDAAAATTTTNAVTCAPGTSVTLFGTGDSIRAWDNYHDWLDRLRKEYADNGKTCYVFNFGAGTTQTNYQTNADLKTRYGTWIDRFDMDAFVAWMGTNDAGAGVTTGQLTTNLQTGTQEVTLAKSKPILYFCQPWSGASLAPRNANNASYDAVFTALAAANPTLVKWQGNTIRETTTNGQSSMFQEAAGSELHLNATGMNAIVPLDYTFITANIPTSSISAVTIPSGDITVLGGSTTAITPTVTGTGDFSTATTLTKQSGPGSVSGNNFIAPAATESIQETVVRQTSVQDPTKYAEITIDTAAIVVIEGSVTVTRVVCTNGSLIYQNGGASVDLNATVEGANSPSQTVTFRLVSGLGTLNTSTGVYVSPAATTYQQVAVVEIISSQDPSKKAYVSIVTNLTVPDTSYTYAGGGSFVGNGGVIVPVGATQIVEMLPTTWRLVCDTAHGMLIQVLSGEVVFFLAASLPSALDGESLVLEAGDYKLFAPSGIKLYARSRDFSSSAVIAKTPVNA